MTATAAATLRSYVDRATEAFERGRFGNDETGRGDDHGQRHEDLVGDAAMWLVTLPSWWSDGLETLSELSRPLPLGPRQR